MLTDWLLAHRWFGPLVVLLLLTVLPVLGWWVASRPRLGRVLVGVATAAVLLFTLVPAGSPIAERTCTVQWALPTFGSVELMANVLLFVPPVALAAVHFRAPLLSLLVAVVASAAIEVVQAVVLSLGRSCDTTDWLCNSVGAAVGAAIGGAVIVGRARWRARRSRSSAVK